MVGLSHFLKEDAYQNSQHSNTMSHIPENSSPFLLTWQLLLVLFTLSSLRAGPMSVYLCLLILCLKQQYLGVFSFGGAIF